MIIKTLLLTMLAAGNLLAVCQGRPLAQVPVDVTAQFSVAPGVSMRQLTTAGPNFTSYIDTPFAAAGGIVYATGNPNAPAWANLDGSGAELLAAAPRFQVTATAGQKLVYWLGPGSGHGTWDIYLVDTSASGPCLEKRLTHDNMIPVKPNPQPQLSTAALDASGHNVIAYSPNNLLYRVKDDGTALPVLTLADPEAAQPFHRIRTNPKFPQWVAYKRLAGGGSTSAAPEIWLVNTAQLGTVYKPSGALAAGHQVWSPDGTRIGTIVGGQWYVITVLNPDGAVNTAFPTAKIPLPHGFSADFVNWSPDGSKFVVTTSKVNGEAIYLMNPDGSGWRFLASTGAEDLTYNGVPFAAFADAGHIVFRSDKSGQPEVYSLTGF